MSTRSPSTAGERLFSAYLRQRRLPFTFEAKLGGVRPDFRVRHPAGDVVLDVYEPELRLPEGTSSFSSYPALRRVFNARKRKQAKAAAANGLPFVAVLRRTNSDLAFDPLLVAGAMFGNIGIRFPVRVGDGGAGSPYEKESAVQVFGRDGKVRTNVNTSVSAVAILRSFNPTLWRFELRAQRELRQGAVSSFEEASRWALRRQALMEEMEHRGVIDLDASVARLIVMHNPYAAVPLPLEHFGGPHDSQWSTFDAGGTAHYGPIVDGRLSWERPDVLCTWYANDEE